MIESENIGDFLNKAEYISQISNYDRDMLNQFQTIVKDVEEKEAALQTEYSELEVLQNELISKQEEVQTMLDNTNVELADLEKQIGENASTLKALIAQAEEERENRKKLQPPQQPPQLLHKNRLRVQIVIQIVAEVLMFHQVQVIQWWEMVNL